MAGAGVGGRLPAAHVDADVEQAQLSRDDAAHLGAQHSTRAECNYMHGEVAWQRTIPTRLGVQCMHRCELAWKRQCCAAHRAAGERVEHDDGAVVAACRATGARREPRVGRLTQRGVEDTRACSTAHIECMPLDSTSHGRQHGLEMGSRRSSACQ